MFRIIVCIKQVPMVSELPWDSKTGTLKRELAQGMMDPGSARALEAALGIKEKGVPQREQVHITAVTMGPPMAQEILHQARALGADAAVLLTDRKLAGADTFMTSRILAQCIDKVCPDVDLVLLGAQSSDSETAQVGPQLADELGFLCIGFANGIEMKGQGSDPDRIRVFRHVDDFFEELEMALPGVVTIDLGAYDPRYTTLAGVENAFENPDIRVLDAQGLGFEPGFNALKASPTRIIDVFSPTAQKENRVLKGAVKTSLDTLFRDYGKVISGAMGRDLKTHDHGEKS